MAPYADSIRDGFGLVNRNWQLIVLKLVVSVIYFILTAVLIGIPIVIAIVVVGIDAAAFSNSSLEGFISGLENPAELIGRYIGIVAVFFIFLLIHLSVVSMIWIYVMGGEMGVIRRAIEDPSFRFTAGEFFAEARKYFMPMFGYLSALLFLLMMATVMLGVLTVSTVLGVGLLGGFGGETAGTFFMVFAALFIVVVAIALAVVFYALIYYGPAAVVLGGKRNFGAIGEAVGFLKKNPSSLGWLLLMFFGYVVVVMTVNMVSFVINMIPLVGFVTAIPLQLVSIGVQQYIHLVIASAVLYDYGRKTNVVPDDSILVADILDEEGSGPPPSPRSPAGPP